MPEKLSQTIGWRDFITDEERLIEVLAVGAFVSGRDARTNKYLTLQLSDVDAPGRWRPVVPAIST